MNRQMKALGDRAVLLTVFTAALILSSVSVYKKTMDDLDHFVLYKDI